MVQPTSINPPVNTRAAPVADIFISDWTRNDGSATDLFQAVDEASEDTGDYVQTSLNPNDAVYTAQLSSTAGLPGVRWVYYSFRKDGSGPTHFRAELLEAGQLRQTWDHPNVTLEWEHVRQRVTVDIGDWSDVSVRIVANPVEVDVE